MYKEHFGFSGELFGEGLATDTAVFQSMRQKRLAANLSIALTRRDSVAVVYGAPGTGKTTIISHALRETTTRLALGCIVHAPQTPHELLEQLLTEFGFTPYKNSRTERLQNWRQFLGEMSATETRVSILVENAQDLPTEVLKALHDLTVADASGSTGSNLILTATTALDDLLTAPALTALRQRIRLQATLPPLTVEEARDYLTFRLAAVGASYDEIFAPDAAPILHAVSGGIIRVIDNVVESALAVAAARREATVSGQLLKRVAVRLCRSYSPVGRR